MLTRDAKGRYVLNGRTIYGKEMKQYGQFLEQQARSTVDWEGNARKARLETLLEEARSLLNKS